MNLGENMISLAMMYTIGFPFTVKCPGPACRKDTEYLLVVMA